MGNKSNKIKQPQPQQPQQPKDIDDDYVFTTSTMAKDNSELLSNSGILVENPTNTTTTKTASTVSSSTKTMVVDGDAVFTADLSSNKSKNNKPSSSTNANNRRIIKATVPSSSSSNNNDGKKTMGVSSVVDGGVIASPSAPDLGTSPSTLLSPRGKEKTNELLEESFETTKSKRLVRATNKQKNDREKLLQEKRHQNTATKEQQNLPKANPFSKFMANFRMESSSHPKHKRKDSGSNTTAADGAKTTTTATPASTTATLPETTTAAAAITAAATAHNKNNSNSNTGKKGITAKGGNGDSDANKRVKYAFNDTRSNEKTTATTIATASNNNSDATTKKTEDESPESDSSKNSICPLSLWNNLTTTPSTTTVVAVTSVAVMVLFTFLRVSKKK